ncbi:unnamed protein product [Rotaria sp. Silwood1]|nr:unnamed protein product [Rotaria sp. Silwood1]
MFYWVYLLFLFLSSSSTKTLKYDFQNQSFRAPIVTLTHGDPLRSDYLLPQYLRTYHNNCKSYCFPFQSYNSIYNNCFLTRVQFWYQKIIEKFLNNLLLNDSILIHSLGDGNIHAVIFALTSDTKRSQKIQFTYAHNIHIYGKRNKNFDLQHN